MIEPRFLFLPDGRRLCFGEVGDPDGRPIIYCHGFPSCRLELKLWETAAREERVRLIAPDRPGYGQSDFQPGRRLSDWPDEVVRLADHLALERFAMLGVSGGGPYAMACGIRIPERITRIGIVCGVGSLAGRAATAGMGFPAVQFVRFARSAPRLAQILYTRVVGPFMQRFPGTATAILRAGAPPIDHAVLAEPMLRGIFLAASREAFRQGGRGAAWDLHLYTRGWDIDPSTIAVETWLWHGEDDRTVPVAMGREHAACIAGCCAEFLPAEGHFSLLVGHAGAILRTLGG